MRPYSCVFNCVYSYSPDSRACIRCTFKPAWIDAMLQRCGRSRALWSRPEVVHRGRRRAADWMENIGRGVPRACMACRLVVRRQQTMWLTLPHWLIVIYPGYRYLLIGYVAARKMQNWKSVARYLMIYLRFCFFSLFSAKSFSNVYFVLYCYYHLWRIKAYQRPLTYHLIITEEHIAIDKKDHDSANYINKQAIDIVQIDSHEYDW